MRALFVLIAVVAVGYLGWSIYREWQPPVESAAPGISAESATMAFPPGARVATTNSTPISPTLPASPATQTAPPGVFYVLERISTQTPTGVKALNPGDQVRLMYRNKNGTMLVTDGSDEFTVKATALTQDLQRVPGGIPR